MRDWIVGYEKAAQQKSPGVAAEEWTEAEETLGTAPEELSDLYRQMNGATFSSGVHLFPLRAEGPHRGVLEESRISVAGLPDSGLWRFGEKSSKHLFALKKADAVALEGAPSHEWLEALADDAWVYGVKDELTQVVKLYRSLEALLSPLIPPVESEEFGERTYARAMTLVQSALDGLDDQGERTDARAPALGEDDDDETGEHPALQSLGDDDVTPAPTKKKAPPAAKKGPSAARAKPGKKAAAAKKQSARQASRGTKKVAKKGAAKASKPAAKKKVAPKKKQAAVKSKAKVKAKAKAKPAKKKAARGRR